jgi:hypothetical protein
VAEEIPQGGLTASIDPKVAGGYYHNYYLRDPGIDEQDTVTVSLTVATGTVSLNLYLRCAFAGRITRTSTSSPNPPLTGTGSGKFDLVTYGRDSPSNSYQLRGTWSYSYLTTMPSETAPRVTC